MCATGMVLLGVSGAILGYLCNSALLVTRVATVRLGHGWRTKHVDVVGRQWDWYRTLCCEGSPLVHRPYPGRMLH